MLLASGVFLKSCYHHLDYDLLGRGRARTLIIAIPIEAASANAAPKSNATRELNRSHSAPKRIEAGSAPSPIVKLYQPNAVPRRAAGTMSVTRARSVPSVRPKKIP